jgi:3-oxoacyl-[acyl-carrier-protein] synthase-3
MAFQENKNVKIVGISACVPKNIEDNRELALLGDQNDIKKFIDSTGIICRRTVSNKKICTSDLCFEAAQKLIEELKWDRNDIDCLILVTQTPDYLLPSTACILQGRLGLSKDCFAMEISQGCSGWVYGLSTITSLLSSGNMKRALLLVGDTVTVTKSKKDKSTYPLFGDAGTATAIEFESKNEGMIFNTGTDGDKYECIIIRDGGFRNPFTSESLVVKEQEPGIFRNNLQSFLHGQNVFIFGISRVPKSIKALLEKYELDKNEIDFFVFHQANLLMTEQIRKKIKIESEKVPYSLDEFGNTSSASIPLTIVTRLGDKLKKGDHKLLACGFGVGLSWGTVVFNTSNLVCPELIEI